jgi:hypothetical protein
VNITDPDAKSKYEELISKRRIVDGCWIYRGHVGDSKIPMTTWKKRSISLRRCMYLIYFSYEEVPGSVYSKCQDPRCFNPEHLTLERPKMRKIYI